MNRQITELMQEIIVERIENLVAERLDEHFNGVERAKKTEHRLLMELMGKTGNRPRAKKSSHTFLKFIAALALVHHYSNQKNAIRLLKAIHQYKPVPTSAAPPPAPTETPFHSR